MIDETIPRAVLQETGLPTSARLTRAAGGFSGAAVWRVDCDIGCFALKQYPTPFDVNHLRFIHELITQARQAGITVLPEVQRFTNMQSWLEHAGAVWDVVSWQPGEPLLNKPTAERLRAAGSLLGQLHRMWSSTQQVTTNCPAVERRLSSLKGWLAIALNVPKGENIAKLLWGGISRHAESVELEVAQYSNRMFRTQACMCDCWHGHFLFTGDEVTGLIDHGAVRVDSPIADLARLLGSMNITHEQRLILLDGYQQHRVLTLEDYELLRVFQKSGLICALIYWYKRGVPYEAHDRVRSLVRITDKLN